MASLKFKPKRTSNKQFRSPFGFFVTIETHEKSTKKQNKYSLRINNYVRGKYFPN